MPTKTLASYEVRYQQVVDENGKVDTKLEPKIPKDTLLAMYRNMVLSRVGDERMLNLQRQGRIGTFGMCFGQEAIPTAAAFAMQPDDWFVGSYRELAGRLARGETLRNPMSIYAGLEEGIVMPDSGMPRTTPINIIIASQYLHATGLAYASKLKGEKTVAVAFCGDGATSQGDFHEALNFASTWQVPVVFVVQNNHWAISVPLRKQMHSKTIAQKAIAYDMPGLQIDGNDLIGCYKAIGEAIEHARAGNGPTLIEAITYRLLMHTTADDPTKYRNEDEVKPWWPREPIGRMKKYLESKKLWNDKKDEELRADIKAQIDAMIEDFEKNAGNFKPDAPFDFVYGTDHALTEEQRAAFHQRLKDRADVAARYSEGN
jgi:pyruvate dehydrogenase E1 component alpha subunit